jgi:hypothetical protein
MVDMATRRPATGARPGWDDVHGLIEQLCATRATFRTATSVENSISQYEPNVRLMLESERGTRWVSVDDVRGCWETFERLGTINRGDLLEPGRCSAFMFALFAQVEGVEADAADEARLALPRR